ncbi:MAG: hypothetical protein PHR92_04200 [Lachnospiraceae bacterium]|nr:hypothetical protein [Lachnospiraceae bacterium]
MKSKGKIAALSALVLLAVCLSVLLPYGVQRYRDQQQIGVAHLRETPLEQQLSAPPLSVFDKLRLLSGGEAAVVSTGNMYTEAEIKVQCTAELKLLYDGGVLTQNPGEVPWMQQTATAALLLGVDDSAQGMILWTVNFSSDTVLAQCGIDDETGKILYLYAANFEGASPVISEEQIHGLAAYWGAAVSSESRQQSSFTPAAISLPQGDSFQNDYQYLFSWDDAELTIHAAETTHGIFLGHNLLLPQ